MNSKLSLFQTVTETVVSLHETIPQYFKDATIIHQYIREGNAQIRGNYTGIAICYCLLPVLCGDDSSKILHLDQAEVLPESQCEFRKDRRTIDMIFSVRHFQEEYQKQNMDLYITFFGHYQLTQSVIMSFG